MNIHQTADIYVIDDEPLDSLIAKLLVRKFDKDLKVEAINNAREAIDQLGSLAGSGPSFLPDYIFLDLDMPEMDGWDFLFAYQQLGLDEIKKIPVYVVSSSLDSRDVERSLGHPLVYDFISKPLSLENLTQIFQPA